MRTEVAVTKIIEYLAEQSEPVAQAKILEALNLNWKVCLAALQLGIKRRQLARIGKGVRGDPHVYFLAKATPGKDLQGNRTN